MNIVGKKKKERFLRKLNFNYHIVRNIYNHYSMIAIHS